MVYLMDEQKLNLEENERQTFFLFGDDSCSLAPPPELRVLWDNNGRTEQIWEIVNQAYLKDLTSPKCSAFIEWLRVMTIFLDADFNLVCRNESFQHHILSTLESLFFEIGVDCFVKS